MANNYHVIDDVDNYNKVVATNDKVVVNLCATWCQPCKIMKEYIKDKATRCTSIQFVELDIDWAEENDLTNADINDVRSVPTFLFYKNMELIFKSIGADKKEFNKGIKALYGEKVTDQ